MERRPFVLSGGGARGAAHLGVLQALAEADIAPSAISATSAGALVGAFIVDGYSPAEVMSLLRDELKGARLIRRPIPASRRIAAFLARHLRHRHFEDLAVPLFVSATDFERGGQRIFSTGEIIPALMAACAIPVLFPPVKVDGTSYVDGGLSNNLPVEPFLDRKAEVVGVYVNPLPPFVPDRRSVLRTMDRAWHLNFREMVTRSAQGCHLFIEPPGLARFGMFEVGKVNEIHRVGYEYVKELLAARGTDHFRTP